MIAKDEVAFKSTGTLSEFIPVFIHSWDDMKDDCLRISAPVWNNTTSITGLIALHVSSMHG